MRSNRTKTTAALLLGGLLALSVLSEPSLAGTQASNARQGLPGRRISGGSRSPNTACLTTPNQPVVAIMPESNLGLTLSGHPKLWFSLPAINPDRTLEFGLYNEAGELLYQTTFRPSGKAEVASLSIPETFAPLDIAKNYRWYLSVVCNPENRAEDLVVTGWVRRIQPNSLASEQLATATPQDRLIIYEQAEIWYDTLTALAELLQREPGVSNSEQQWISLLESIDLPQVITVPLGNELTPIPTTTAQASLPPQN